MIWIRCQYDFYAQNRLYLTLKRFFSFLCFKKTKMKTNWSTQAPSVKELIQQFSVSLKTKYDYFHVTSLMRRFGKCHVCINRKTVWYCMYINDIVCIYKYICSSHLAGTKKACCFDHRHKYFILVQKNVFLFCTWLFLSSAIFWWVRSNLHETFGQ